MSRRRPVSLGTSLLCAVLAVGVSGCGSDDEAAPTPSSGASTSPSESPSEASPSAEPEPFPVAFGEDLTIDGVDARTIEGSGGGVHVFVLKSLLTQPEQLSLTLEIRTTGSRALHRERVESVLASWEWR